MSVDVYKIVYLTAVQYGTGTAELVGTILTLNPTYTGVTEMY